MIKVSVIVPVFNAEKYLEKCLQNLVNQTLDDIEIILTVDETSADSSLDICKSYERKYPEKVKVLVHPKGLPGDSRNYGLEVASGEYIGFVDSDDSVLDIMFEKLYQKAAENDADISCCEIQYCYTDGKTKLRKINNPSGISAISDPSVLYNATCYVWNKIFRKTLIDKYHFRFPEGRWYEDSALVYNMVWAANKLEFVHVPLYEYKVRRAGGTAHLVDNRIFDVLLSAKDIVTFFKHYNGFEEEMVKIVYKLCREHIDRRIDFFKNSNDNKLKESFIQKMFEFFDEYFPEWPTYHEPIDPEVDALAYAKINKNFALKYFCNKGNCQKYFKVLNKLNKKNRTEKYITSYYETKINEKAILYEAYEGVGMTCNPYALFLVALNDEKLRDYQHIWSIADWENLERLKNNWKNHSNVYFVKRNSMDYFEALSKCKYLINNHSFPPYFTKKKGQVLITSWHGITIKTIGFDFPRGKIESWNQERIYLQTDWFLAANSFMKNNLATAYKMQNIFNGKVLVEGYPRNDFLLKNNSRSIIQKLINCGVKIDDKKEIILYAPTWKGEKFSNPDIDLDTLNRDLDALRGKIDLNKYQLLVKPHQIVYRYLSDTEKNSGDYIPPYLETNEVLSIVNILISDYSSIFVDFMCTKRPVLFYVPDVNEYNDYRGMYFKPDELPGPVSDNIGDIASNINHIDEIIKAYSVKYQNFYDLMFSGIKVGNSSQRVIDCIFHGNEQCYHIETLRSTKKKILIYPGDLKKRNIRSRANRFLDAIDNSIFDVTILIDDYSDPDVSEFFINLPHRIRFLCTGIDVPKSKKELSALNLLKKGGELSKEEKRDLQNLFSREYRRRFGDVKFDATIDLCPKNTISYHLLDQASSAIHIIWPEDYRAETEDIFHRIGYRFANDSDYVRYFVISPWAGNIKKYPKDVKLIGIDDFVEECVGSVKNESLKQIRETYDLALLSSELSTRHARAAYIIPDVQEENYNFVSFSPLVKNGFSDNILRAFQIIVQQFNNVVLYIVAKGDNVNIVKNLIGELGLDDCVSVINTIDAIDDELLYAYISQCDCVIETPTSCEQFYIRPVRLAQAMGKAVIIREKEEGEKKVLLSDHTIVAAPTIGDLYYAMKTTMQKWQDNTQALDVKTLNKDINRDLYNIIENPISKTTLLLNAGTQKSFNLKKIIKKKLKKTVIGKPLKRLRDWLLRKKISRIIEN